MANFNKLLLLFAGLFLNSICAQNLDQNPTQAKSEKSQKSLSQTSFCLTKFIGRNWKELCIIGIIIDIAKREGLIAYPVQKTAFKYALEIIGKGLVLHIVQELIEASSDKIVAKA